jgi:uncharacterized protein
MTELLIKIRDIPESGQDLSVAFDRALLHSALEGMDADLGRSAIDARMQVLRTNDNVFVRGDLRGEVQVPCVRCLAPARVAIDVPLKLTATPEDLAAGDDAVEDDVDYFTHDGETLDLSDVLREALILAVPMTALCRADCKGLCPVCGGDRNERACDCLVPSGDPRLAALKDLKV